MAAMIASVARYSRPGGASRLIQLSSEISLRSPSCALTLMASRRDSSRVLGRRLCLFILFGQDYRMNKIYRIQAHLVNPENLVHPITQIVSCGLKNLMPYCVPSVPD